MLAGSNLMSLLTVTGEGMKVTSEEPGAAVSDESPWAWEHCGRDTPEKPRSSVASLCFQSKPGRALTHLAVSSHLKNLSCHVLVP